MCRGPSILCDKCRPLFETAHLVAWDHLPTVVKVYATDAFVEEFYRQTLHSEEFAGMAQARASSRKRLTDATCRLCDAVAKCLPPSAAGVVVRATGVLGQTVDGAREVAKGAEIDAKASQPAHQQVNRCLGEMGMGSGEGVRARAETSREFARRAPEDPRRDARSRVRRRGARGPRASERRAPGRVVQVLSLLRLMV